MTPYELSICIESFQERQQAELQNSVTLAWLREYYHRQKYLPDLKKELAKLSGVSEEMSDEDMLKMVKNLNLQFGGEIIQKEGE